MNKRILGSLIGLLLPLGSQSLVAAGWGEQQSLQFRLIGMGRYNESLRLNFNQYAATSGSAGGSYLDESQSEDIANQNNVIQITENYEIVLNGDSNLVDTKGTVLNGEQDSETTSQDGNNALSSNTSRTSQLANDAETSN
ncbi:MAG: hypothetical protein GY764_01920 [Halieaceae bacterium]|nr:hypothetical protein [Halieaceae bacterium]